MVQDTIQPGLATGGKPLPPWVAAPSLLVQAVVGSSVLLIWLLTEWASHTLLTGPSISGWYPPAGVGLAVLWFLGMRYVWVIGLGAAMGMFAVWGYGPTPAASIAITKMLTYGVSAWGLRQIVPAPVQLSRPSQVAGMLMVMLACAFATALLSLGIFKALGLLQGDMLKAVMGWWIGDAIGILVVAPLVVLVVAPTLCDRFCQPSTDPPAPILHRALRPALLIVTTVGIIVGAYCLARGQPDFRVFYLGFAALPTIAMGYGLRGGLVGLFCLNTAGMFAIGVQPSDVPALQDLQLVMIALAICTLLVGSFSTMRATAAAAAESVERWANLAFRGSGMGRWFWQVGTDNYVTDHVLSDLLGYDAQQVPHRMSWWEPRIHPEDLPTIQLAMRRHLEGRADYFDTELRMQDAQGQWVWIYSQGTIIARDDQGRPTQVAGTHTEITERKRLQELQTESEAWHRSEQRFRLLADSAPVGIFQTDDHGAFLYMNPAWAEMTGFELSDALYRHAAAFAYKEDRNRVADAWATATQSATAMTCEHRILTPDGQVRWLATYAKPTPRIEGRPGGFVGTAVDVTEYRDAVQLIRDSETRYRTLADQAHDMLWRVSLNSQFTYVSPSCELLLGYPPEELKGTDALSYFHPDDLERVREKHNSLSPEQPEFKDLHRYRRKDGSYLWFEAVGKFVMPEDDPANAYIVGISRDVTERITAESQRSELESRLRRSQKLDAIGTFATGIAHDFRNTLLAITASVQSAKKKLDEQHPATRSLDLVEDACRQSMEITQSLLTFTRGQGRSKEPADLAGLVNATVRMLRAMLPAQVRIVTDLPASGPWVLCNPSELQQVMMNLATNARDALGSSGGYLSIRLTTPAPGRVRLIFEDEGEGMSPETISRVFEPFFTTKARLKGTGLGLALVHGIVTEHGGEIEIDSTPSRGTAVTITLSTIQPHPDPTEQLIPTAQEHAS